MKGNESIFQTDERISLPDEVLLFNTGSHRDKALLLYSLIHHATQIPKERKKNMDVVYTNNASYVHVDGTYINTKTFVVSERTPESITHRLNEKRHIS